MNIFKNINNKREYSRLIVFTILCVIILISYIIFISTNKNNNNSISIPINEEYSFLNTDSIKKIDNISTYNNSLYDDYYKDYNSNNYYYENPKVIVNPFNNNPLSALIMFKTIDLSKVSLTLNNLYTYNYPEDVNHIIPLYYLNQGSNKVILNVDDNTYEFNINIDYIDNNSSGTKLYDDNNNLKVLLNNYDDYVLLSNNHLLVRNNKYPNILYEIDYLGYIYNIYYLNIDTINNIIVLPNNDILVMYSNNNILEINLNDLVINNTYDINAILNNSNNISNYSYNNNYLYIKINNNTYVINMANKSLDHIDNNYVFNDNNKISIYSESYFTNSELNIKSNISNSYSIHYDINPDDFKNSKYINNNISYIDNYLSNDTNYELILLSTSGYSYIFDNSKYHNISDLPLGNYYIYLRNNNIIYTTNSYITKNS